VARKKSQQKKNWYKMDLHLHTPASADYQEKTATYLDILRLAETRGLDIISFADHNTVNGYQMMLNEIDQLAHLEVLGRAEPDESRRLADYRRLLDKILVLRGFEFTATFGFHILGYFAPDTPIRKLEHVLMDLNVPFEAMERGSSDVGASADVLTAYEVIREAGGLAIAAHANSSNGVAMRGMDFGGQTRIAYTQSENLNALEVTDLEKRGRYTTARFFDGTKPGYRRPMRCIQGSDAHRLTASPQKPKDLGIGDRITEVLLPECSFEALERVFENNDLSLTRPFRSSRDPYDHIHAAREEGETIVQSFHPSMARKGGDLHRVIADICAFANTNGGTVYIGASHNPKETPIGVTRVSSSIDTLYAEIDQRISPHLDVSIDSQNSQGKAVIRAQVPHGSNLPYAIDDNKIYIRDESETTLAVRDEIVRLVKGDAVRDPDRSDGHTREKSKPEPPSPEEAPKASPPSSGEPEPPRTGVEVVGTEKRRGTQYHMMRDLRNNNIIHNVTRSSARRLWHYAITETEDGTFDEHAVQWDGPCGLVKRYKRAGAIRHDLAQRVKDKSGKEQIRIYYGVTEDGMHGPWGAFISEDDAPDDD
jgi:hypothetical protein